MKRDQQGIALVITLFLMATLSALAVSMMFLAQTETAASRNYRTMSQARYAAEGGVHKTINYLLNSYLPPSAFSSYDMTKTPVTCISGCGNNAAAGASCTATSVATAVSTGCVVLSGMSGISSNYPDSTITTAFNTAAAGTGTLAVNGSGTTTNAAMGTVTYGVAAILMSMRSVTPYGSTSSSVIQTWQIISDGIVPPSNAAIVEVSAALEREFGEVKTFAVFATGTGCGAIDLQGNVQTASYDGSAVSNTGGNVGTNGNMTIGGHVDVHGSLSSPRTGIGTCTTGSNMTALTTGGAATVDGNNVIQLPQALSFPAPSLPSPMPPTTSQSNATAVCNAVNLQQPLACTVVSGVATIDPLNTGITIRLGNVSTDLVLKGGKYSINSISSGDLKTATSASGSSNVVINLAGKNSDGTQMATPFDLTGHALFNASMDASKLEILYAGSGNIEMTGGSTAAFLLYAPNAHVTTHGNADIYGSILAAGVTSAGTPRFIYDTRLQKKLVTLGNYMMTSFSWKKY